MMYVKNCDNARPDPIPPAGYVGIGLTGAGALTSSYFAANNLSEGNYIGAGQNGLNAALGATALVSMASGFNAGKNIGIYGAIAGAAAGLLSDLVGRYIANGWIQKAQKNYYNNLKLNQAIVLNGIRETKANKQLLGCD